MSAGFLGYVTQSKPTLSTRNGSSYYLDFAAVAVTVHIFHQDQSERPFVPKHVAFCLPSANCFGTESDCNILGLVFSWRYSQRYRTIFWRRLSSLAQFSRFPSFWLRCLGTSVLLSCSYCWMQSLCFDLSQQSWKRRHFKPYFNFTSAFIALASEPFARWPTFHRISPPACSKESSYACLSACFFLKKDN